MMTIEYSCRLQPDRTIRGRVLSNTADNEWVVRMLKGRAIRLWVCPDTKDVQAFVRDSLDGPYWLAVGQGATFKYPLGGHHNVT